MLVLDFLEEWKLSWFDHVKRMEDQMYPQKMLDWVAIERRPTGRLRTRWMKGVEEALERKGTSLFHLQENATYEDRDV